MRPAAGPRKKYQILILKVLCRCMEWTYVKPHIDFKPCTRQRQQLYASDATGVQVLVPNKTGDNHNCILMSYGQHTPERECGFRLVFFAGFYSSEVEMLPKCR